MSKRHLSSVAFAVGLVGCTQIFGIDTATTVPESVDAAADLTHTADAKGHDATGGDATTNDASPHGDGSGGDGGNGDGSGSGSDAAHEAASDSAAGDAGPACVIGGKTYPAGTTSPSSPCQTCQPALAASAWSNVANGVVCGDGGNELCISGACVTGCAIVDGTGTTAFFATGTQNPNDACEVCQPSASASAWSNVSDGTGCGNNQICGSGQCGTQCDIGGAVYLSGVANPNNDCMSCQPGKSTTSFVNVVDGTGCGVTGATTVCSAGSCVACLPGMTNMVPCGNCGTDTQTCVNSAWQDNSCDGQGACAANATGVRCNTNGTTTCSATCVLDEAACTCAPPVCVPTATQCSSPPNGIETCDSCGQWGAAVACAQPNPNCTGTGEGVCGCTSGTVCTNVCVNEQTDGNNCGACGRSCQGGACTSGVCQPVLLASGQGAVDALTADSTSVYFTSGTSIARVVVSTGVLSTLATAQPQPSAIAVDANNVYWTNYLSAGNVMKAPLSVGAATQVGTATYPNTVAVYGGELYWGNSGSTGSVVKAAITGGTATTLAMGQYDIFSLATDGTNVYWLDYGSAGNNGTVMKISVGGGTAAPLYSNQAQVAAIATDGTSVYWTDQSGPVNKVGVTGANFMQIANDGPAGPGGAPTGIAVDATNVYWTVLGAGCSQRSGAVKTASLTGANPTVLASGQDTPGNIAISAVNVFWSDCDGNVWRVAK